MTTFPLASSACTWNTDLVISRPIVIALMADGSPLRWVMTSHGQLGTSDAVRVAATQHCEAGRCVSPKPSLARALQDGHTHPQNSEHENIG